MKGIQPSFNCQVLNHIIEKEEGVILCKRMVKARGVVEEMVEKSENNKVERVVAIVR